MEEEQNIYTWKQKDGISFEKFLDDIRNNWKVKGIACIIPIAYFKGNIEAIPVLGFTEANVIAEAIVIANMHMIRSGGGDC